MKDSLAIGKVKLAIDRLASDYPLHAGILTQWRIEEDAAVQTMGVGFAEGRLRLVVCPEFAESITMDELTGVLHHEANHVLFDHVLHQPSAREDRMARTVAEEVTVNEWVPEPLPGHPVVLADYPHLPPNDDTETRYRKLRKRTSGSNGAGGNKNGASVRNQGGRGGPAGGGTGRGAAASRAVPSQNRGGCGQPPGPAGPFANGVPTVDNHATWQEVAQTPKQAAGAIKMDVALAWGTLTAQQRKKVAEPFASIAAAVQQDAGMASDPATGMGCGAGTEAAALADGTARVSWQVVLRRHVGKILERRPVFGRPPRRFPELVGIIPGRVRFAAKPKVMAVIDTSGSMSNPMLADISAELGVMAKQYDVIVVECDTEIHAVYPYEPITTVHGRGGTDFRPPLETHFLKKQGPDLVVYFTDGCGPAPEKAPAVPVVWCITEGGQKPVTWGREVRLHEPENGTHVPDIGP